MNSQKYFYIKTFGCQMNVHDSARAAEVLRTIDFQPTDDVTQADLILINTCSVREKSHQKVISTLGRLGQLKQQRPQLLLAVFGCVAQQEGQRLLDRVAALDIVFSPDHIADLPLLVQQATRQRQAKTGFADPESYAFLTADPDAPHGPTALVTVQKGCDNSCSYCIVPSVRGPTVSRPLEEIVHEVQTLVGQGTREVTLIGQNVNAYRGAAGTADDFITLLRVVDAVDGLKRLRFTTSHPKDVHPELAACFRDLNTLCPWLHLPVQSGATRVLQSMSRGYTREQYVERVHEVRAARPDVTVGTDLIVGFPGESEADFEDTLSLVEEIQFDYSYYFKFSVRPGTTAANLADDVGQAVKTDRLHRLQRLQDQLTVASLARQVGREVEVLVEGPSRKGLPQLCGRTPGNQIVNFLAPDGGIAAGQLVRVRVTAGGRHSLSGELATGQP